MAEPQSRALAAGTLPRLRRGDQRHDPLLPHGIEATGHAWLHSRCWSAWHAGTQGRSCRGPRGNGDRDTRPGFQTISKKTEARDGRLRIGTAERLGRDKVEACRSIDVNRLHREGCLRAGSMASCQWSRDGDKVTPTNMRAEHDRLHLTYRVRIGGGEWEDVNETVRIVRMPCRFGGARPYFVCPGVVNGTACGRRVAKLYGPGRYFLCRHCYRLAHCQPERGRAEALDAAREQDQATPRRQCRNSLASSAEAEGHVAANL